MMKELIQLAAVLAITLFLAAGCASTVAMPEGPFDFSVMREMEDAGRMFGRMANVVPMSNNALNQYDLAWAKYHAGQIAVAQGHYQEAQDYFKDALAGIEAMLAPRPINPSLSF